MDKSKFGIDTQLADFSNLIKRHCPEVWHNLKILKVDHKFFALRWIILLLSQEYSISETQKLWDLLLASEIGFRFLHYLMLGLIINIRKELICDDFSDIVKLLQGAADRIDVNHLKIIALNTYKLDLEIAEG